MIKHCPIQHISRTNEVHLFVEWSLADPFFRLTVQTKRNPSFTSPSDAKYCEFELNAKLRTPNVCSLRMDSGWSDDESLLVE